MKLKYSIAAFLVALSSATVNAQEFDDMYFSAKDRTVSGKSYSKENALQKPEVAANPTSKFGNPDFEVGAYTLQGNVENAYDYAQSETTLDYASLPSDISLEEQTKKKKRGLLSNLTIGAGFMMAQSVGPGAYSTYGGGLNYGVGTGQTNGYMSMGYGMGGGYGYNPYGYGNGYNSPYYGNNRYYVPASAESRFANSLANTYSTSRLRSQMEARSITDAQRQAAKSYSAASRNRSSQRQSSSNYTPYYGNNRSARSTSSSSNYYSNPNSRSNYSSSGSGNGGYYRSASPSRSSYSGGGSYGGGSRSSYSSGSTGSSMGRRR